MNIRILGVIISIFLFAGPVVAAGTETADAARIQRLIDGLKGWNRDAIQANADSLLKIGEPAVPYLIKALKNDDPGIRGGAARLLGEIEAEEAVIPLGELLGDPKTWVTRSAVFSLGKIGSPAALPLLKKALGHFDPKVQEAALIGLDELQDQSVMPEIAALMVSSNDQYIRWQAMLVLQSMKEGSEITALLAVLNDPKATGESRRNAAAILGELKVASAVPDLLKAVDAKDAGLRWRAIEALGKIGAQQARPAIEAKLADPDRDVQMFAIGALGRLGSEESLPALQKMLSSTSADVRKNTIRSLGRIGGTEAAKAIRGTLSDRDMYVRVMAVETLVDLNDTGAAEEIKLLASDQSPSVRSSVMYALGRLGGPDVEEVLKAGTTDKNPWVKQEAEKALKKLAP